MTKKILFLCGHNASRSQMAEAFFNRLNKNKKYTGISAGTNIASKINPDCVLVMKEIGIDISSQHPKKVTMEMLKGSEKLFSMGCNVKCDLPYERKFDDDWNIDDPYGKPISEVKKIMDLIKNKTMLLIKELEIK